MHMDPYVKKISHLYLIHSLSCSFGLLVKFYRFFFLNLFGSFDLQLNFEKPSGQCFVASQEELLLGYRRRTGHSMDNKWGPRDGRTQSAVALTLNVCPWLTFPAKWIHEQWRGKFHFAMMKRKKCLTVTRDFGQTAWAIEGKKRKERKTDTENWLSFMCLYSWANGDMVYEREILSVSIVPFFRLLMTLYTWQPNVYSQRSRKFKGD